MKPVVLSEYCVICTTIIITTINVYHNKFTTYTNEHVNKAHYIGLHSNSNFYIYDSVSAYIENCLSDPSFMYFISLLI